MDFYKDDELDYEDAENLENSEGKNSKKDEINDDSNVSGFDDQYLQIDLSEDEENLVSDETIVKSACFVNQTSGKDLGNKEIKGSNEQNSSSEKEEFTQLKKKCLTPCKNQLQFKKNKVHNLFDGNFDVSARIDRKKHLLHFQHSEKGKIRGFKHTRYVRKNNNFKKKSNFNFNTHEDRSYDTKNENRSFKAQYNLLQEEEKTIVKLKKEARLRRFMHDGVKTEKKFVNSYSEKLPDDNLDLGEQHSQEIEDKKPLNEGFLNTKTKQKKNSGTVKGRNILTIQKPDINKELLLKKRNPFDEEVEMSDYTSAIKLKGEIEKSKVKEDCVMNKFFKSAEDNQELMGKETNILTIPHLTCRSLCAAKTDAESNVKFVRTVSKSFYELALKGGYPTRLSNSLNSLPFMRAGLDNCVSPRNDSVHLRYQVESQLIGCIVKVMNIPPSTTIKDILALCSPIGVVMEVKLNFPKENSVVIRFAESICAEKFFDLYDGQKMNNYYLNVIVI